MWAIRRRGLVCDRGGRLGYDRVSSKNSKANRIETGEKSGGIRRNLFGGSRRKIAKKTSMTRMVATKALLLHAWRGASDSGGPPGERNGQYRHGERTKGAIAERQKFSAFPGRTGAQ